MTAPRAEGAGSRLAEQDDEPILDALDKWLERDVRPHVLKLEHDDVYPAAMVEQMKVFGLFGAIIAPRYGGLGMSALTYARVVTLISEAWIALPGAFNTHLIMAALVERFGTEAQKRYFLPRFATGELRGGLALTEADGGTDLQAIRTRAVREGNDYVINGAKTWITNAIEGSCFALLVKTDPDAEPRHRGMSLFLAEKGPGFRVGRKLEKLGYHGSDTAELFFENFQVPAERLIGGAEGHGFVQVMAGLELGRINVAARSVGLANAALKDSLRYAQMRRTFGKPIAQHQAIQLKLADMATRSEAARLLTEAAARAYDRGERCAL
jgi:alkylation response protein AidB-like acyl-CoA dehydrogenase